MPFFGAVHRFHFWEFCRYVALQDIVEQIVTGFGLELVEMAGANLCCGSAGTYNLTQPELADAALESKLESVLATGANAFSSSGIKSPL